jgi:hypothetical protein
VETDNIAKRAMRLSGFGVRVPDGAPHLCSSVPCWLPLALPLVVARFWCDTAPHPSVRFTHRLSWTIGRRTRSSPMAEKTRGMERHIAKNDRASDGYELGELRLEDVVGSRSSRVIHSQAGGVESVGKAHGREAEVAVGDFAPCDRRPGF